MKIGTFNASLTSLSAVLINVMTKYFEVLRTCRASVVMATIYVVMFGLNMNIHNVENTFSQAAHFVFVYELRGQPLYILFE